MIRIPIAVLCLLLSHDKPSVVYASESAVDTVYGKVVDSSTMLPVVGAQITAPRFDPRATSDQDGNFTLILPRNLPSVRVYREGYRVRTYPFGFRRQNDPDTLTDIVFLSPIDTHWIEPISRYERQDCPCHVTSPPEPMAAVSGCPPSVYRGSQSLNLLYGRELSESTPWGRPNVVHVMYDSASGLPMRLTGGSIHVSEICPEIDSLTYNNAADIGYTFLRDNAQLLGIDVNELALRQVREGTTVHRNGREAHVTFDQIRRGVPVFAASIRLYFKYNALYSYQSEYVPTAIETAPTMSAIEAFARAAAVQEAHLDSIGYPGVELRCQSAELMIDVRRTSRTTSSRPPRLVWKFMCCQSWEPGSSVNIIADAHTGRLIRSYSDAIVCFPVFNPGYSLTIPESDEQ